MLSVVTGSGEARVDALRNAERLRDRVAANGRDLARLEMTALQREHDAGASALLRYAAQAEELVQQPLGDRDGAHVGLRTFENAFEQTRQQMASVSASLRAETDRVRAAADARAAEQHRRTGAVVGLALALLAGLALGGTPRHPRRLGRQGAGGGRDPPGQRPAARQPTEH